LKQRLIILLRPDQSVQWYHLSEGRIAAEGLLVGDDIGSFAELAGLSRQCSALLLVPGEQVTERRLTLPGKSREAFASIPYQLEPELAQDVETLAFVAEKPRGSTEPVVTVWITVKQQLERWQQWLNDRDLVVTRVLPDYLLLSAEQGQPLVISDNRVAVVTDGIRGTLPAALGQLLSGSNQAQPLNTELLLSFAEETSDKGHHLLTGFKGLPKQQSKQNWLPVAAVLFISLLLVNVALEYKLNKQLKQQQTQLSSGISEQFNAVLPGRRMVDPEFQLQQALETRIEQARPLAAFEVLHAMLGKPNTELLQLEQKGSSEVSIRLKSSSPISAEAPVVEGFVVIAATAGGGWQFMRQPYQSTVSTGGEQ